MFCSKCGKTLMPEDQRCPHCGNPVGESLFAGAGYTSAQAHILPGGETASAAAYTKTTYTTMTDAEKQEGAVDSRTTYRPVFEGGSAPEEVRKDMRAAVAEANAEEKAEAEAQQRPQVKLEDLSQEALDTLNAVDEELQMEQMDTSDLHSRPIESAGRAGISAGVEEYVQRLEANQSRRASRRRRGLRPAAAPVEEPPAEAAEGQAPEDVYDAPADAPVDYDDAQAEVYDETYDEQYDEFDDEAYDEMDYGRSISPKDILKVAIIMVLAAALIVGGVLWFRNFRASQSSAPIDGVTESLYDQGLAAVKSHLEDTYINELINTYRSDSITGFTQRVTQDSAAIDALLPEEPAVNDSLFISALQAIQSNIGNAILMDAVESEQGTGTDTSEGSASRWAIVNNAISQLEAASTAQELTAILNGEQITAATSPTPSPTPQATYATLVKDDKSDAVLEMQNRLYILGFLLDDRDGAFGGKTQTAVKAFQQAAGLPVTGIADNETLTLMYSEDAPRTEYAQVTPTPRPTDTPAPTEAPAAEAGDAAADAQAGDTAQPEPNA